TVRIALPESMHSNDVVTVPQHIRGYHGQRINVLLVDDDPLHLDIVSNLLKPLGFIVHIAHGGKEGLEMVKRHQPELVMLDISMGDMTGWEVAHEIRAISELKKTRIMMVSANAHEFIQGSETQPHNAFVMKPIDLQVLLENMANVLFIEWEYENELVTAAGQSSTDVTLPATAHRHLDALLQLGRIGHVRGIQAKLREIENEDAANKPFVTQLRGMVTNFDLKRYMNTIEAVRKNA
ncbi:MAG TPA: response regulator, partial [Steroidobacteraceae bacterium]|nr:response regulator [Steroidobacteraceae bacterium]